MLNKLDLLIANYAGTVVLCSKKFKTTRKMRQHTQASLSEKISFGKKTVENAEQGRPIKASTLMQIATALEVLPSSLLSDETTKELMAFVDAESARLKEPNMILVQVGFMHYSQKDSEQGVKEIVIANNLQQAIDYINKEHMFGGLKDVKDDGDQGSYSPPMGFWQANPEKKEQARAMGLTVGKHGDVEGDSHTLTMWHQGNDWQEPTDCYYGVTHWFWNAHQEITGEDAATLLRLGLAKDIRNFTTDENVV